MSMRKVKFRNWEFEVDLELTRKSFANKLNGSSDTCSCDCCKNFREQRESIFPKEIRILFEDLGVNFRKEEYLCEIDQLENGLLNYIGHFHFAGEILSGKTFDSEEYSGPEKLIIDEKARLYFVHPSEYISLMKISRQVDKSISATFKSDFGKLLQEARERTAKGFECNFPVLEKE
ncbi:MAG: hypothetical protein WKF90_11415 [Pyrinomonadaceae bacterium]